MGNSALPVTFSRTSILGRLFPTTEVSAILSSTVDIPVDPDTCFAGELGLSGEIRPVTRIEQRLGEADKLGMKRIVMPGFNRKSVDPQRFDLEIIEVNRVQDIPRHLFG